MTNPAIMCLQEAIVAALMDSILGRRWERIVVNYEMLEAAGGIAHDRLAFYSRVQVGLHQVVIGHHSPFSDSRSSSMVSADRSVWRPIARV